MTTQDVTVSDRRISIPAEIQEKVLVNGDLSALTAQERVVYYNAVCDSLGLNRLTQPFAYTTLDGRLVLYARKDCSEQLRKIHSVSIDPDKFTTAFCDGIYIVTACAKLPNGRTDVSTGAVAIDKLGGQFKANAMMKAETKAKRRVTLSICGLGMPDETEIDTIPGQAAVDTTPTGGAKMLPGDIIPADAAGQSAEHGDLNDPASTDPAADYENQIQLAESVRECSATLNAMEKDPHVSRDNKQALRIVGKQKMAALGKAH